MRHGRCSECGSEFDWSKVKGFVPAWCPPCGDDRRKAQARAKSAAWREADPARAKAAQDRSNAKRLADPEHLRAKREAERVRLYGVTPAEFDRMLAEQHGLCKICGKPPSGKANGRGTHPDREPTLHLDHCHATGRRRGLLCGNCNTLLGLAGDDPVVLLAAAEYLKE